jgi:hypothetical protein
MFETITVISYHFLTRSVMHIFQKKLDGIPDASNKADMSR